MSTPEQPKNPVAVRAQALNDAAKAAIKGGDVAAARKVFQAADPTHAVPGGRQGDLGAY
ncbi:hypothetical protein [Kitasatospora sp. NPDC002965]|uniref:hypothetical protein n=1 Tax=Kitasatospora sp. NPDC002965 TaxID=3154775 RepID=UPI0033BE08B9